MAICNGLLSKICACILLVAGLSISSSAHASPGYDFTCFNRAFSATISLDISWQSAYLTENGTEHELPVNGSPNRDVGSFSFANDSFRFDGFLPEATLFKNDEVAARCFQKADSLKTLALYGKEGRFDWDSYNAVGNAFQNVRAAPSVFADKVHSFVDQESVTILANTDQFLDGFFWFKIEYGEGEQGYIWGALLCTNEDNSELNVTLRKCN